MDILIHIGDAKCGSSAIQAALWSGRDALKSAGILYHPAEASHGHYCYAVILGANTRGNNKRYEKLARQNILETRARVEREGPRAIVLSGESLFHREPKRLDALCREITGEENRLHVLAFVRHPVPLYLSQVQQELTGNEHFTPPRRFLPKMASPLGRWTEHPACVSLSVRLFDRTRLANGSVVAETAAVLRAQFGEAVPNLPDAMVNTSLSAEQIVVMQAFRRDFLADRNNQYDSGAHNAVQLFHQLNRSIGLVGTKPSLVEPLESFIAAQNAQEIAALDRMCPELRMTGSHPVSEVSWQEIVDTWRQDDVRSILRQVDEGKVASLKIILLEYMACSESAIADRVHPVLNGLGARAIPAYQRYLERAGLHAARDALAAAASG